MSFTWMNRTLVLTAIAATAFGPIAARAQQSATGAPFPSFAAPQGFIPPAQQPQPQPNSQQGGLPPGVQSVYALQANNNLLVYGTADGYARIRELVENLTNGTDVVKARVEMSEPTVDRLKSLDVVIDPANPDVSRLVAIKLTNAWKEGLLPRSAHPLRIVTRANTEVDALLQAKSADGGVPISLVPRVAVDGTAQIEILQPISATFPMDIDDTAIVVTPGNQPDSVRLFFITTTIEPSSVRPGR